MVSNIAVVNEDTYAKIPGSFDNLALPNGQMECVTSLAPTALRRPRELSPCARRTVRERARVADDLLLGVLSSTVEAFAELQALLHHHRAIVEPRVLHRHSHVHARMSTWPRSPSRTVQWK
ncbi:hypothetical protein PC129_g19874 [Phytophthora cactorum]|uniref:Uncharacterized protein n=1 Tax=Phytophthora cactorum TaxID=29920 RepID=A0A329RLW9_9STRA|nr:hypothetical protein PC112_g20526 [Phytophthora cactorum]KAG2834282.1 hypothetical protein PC113_g20421 [Phytophthora cactorum]KAG2878189.1 hypothetical protein PC114_g23251 [Phytophthora cactorum]KAG2888248.1 hypothetical protein PC115_g20121 [Phytophthora cactorum]KAG2896279.1 hypothetical protein PC117_g23047 [Phytophthora cactorum]